MDRKDCGTWGLRERKSPGDTQVPAEVTREAGEREDAGPRQMATQTQTHTPRPTVPGQKPAWVCESEQE